MSPATHSLGPFIPYLTYLPQGKALFLFVEIMFCQNPSLRNWGSCMFSLGFICVYSLIGKQVFNVPPESVGDVQNVLAVCDAGQFNNKVCGWCHVSP
jgi:hypothetical protein